MRPLDGATVTVNGKTLILERASSLYVGDVELAPDEQVNVSVIIDGKTYTGTAKQFTDYPHIVKPTADETLHERVPTNVRWTIGTTSAPTAVGTRHTALGVLDAANLAGGYIWPHADDLYDVKATDSFRINDSLSPGNRVVVVGKMAFFNMEGSPRSSRLTVAAFAGQTSTVSSGALASLSITPSPVRLPYRTGMVGTLRAMGNFSDKTIQDFTELVSWSTKDSSVAAVDSLGNITASKEGVTTVTATYGGVTASTQLTIVPPVLSVSDGR
jgi:hypothetical protein